MVIKMKRKITSVIAAAAVALGMLPTAPMPTSTVHAAEQTTRALENLDRGLIVINSGTGMYLSWRLLGTESYDTTYNVYRDGYLIANVADSTNYSDMKGNSESLYQIAPVSGGVEGEKCDAAKQWGGESNYMDIDIPVPTGGTMVQNEIANKKDTGNDYNQNYTYTINDMSTGDLDGDGQYELVVKFMPSNAGESIPPTYTASVILGAYELDGTPLWTDSNGNTLYIDLGLNIRANPHGTQFLVYDFNGDGIAEIATKTAQGTMDTSGKIIIEDSTASDYFTLKNASDYSDTNKNDRINSSLTHVSSNGQVMCGREYYTVFNGNTGAFIDTVEYHTPRTFTYYSTDSTEDLRELDYLWGDDFGNRFERYTSTVAYLDGKTPYAVEWRGYYHGDYSFGRTAVGAYKLVGNDLVNAYTFDTAGTVLAKYKDGTLKWNDIFGDSSNAKTQLIKTNPDWNYCGNGNHNIVAADFDEDGMDEVASGSLCLQLKDGKFGVKWNYNRGHGDAFHIGRNVKKGHLLYFIVHEHDDYGMSVIDPYNDGAGSNGIVGEPVVLFHEGASSDTGRGIMVKGCEGKFFIDSSGNDYREVTYNAAAADDTDDTDGSVTKNGYTFSKVKDTVNGGYKADMAAIGSGNGAVRNSRVYWDGDVYEELLDGFNKIDQETKETTEGKMILGNYNGSGWGRIDEFEGTLMNNSTKNNPCLSADLFGDWREEIICRTSDGAPNRVRIYTTNIPTTEKVYTLMHDSQYRNGVAAEQAAYNQPPHVSWYMGEDMDMAADKPNITTVENTSSITPTATKTPSRTYTETAAKLLWQNNTEQTSTDTKKYVGHVLSQAYTGTLSVHASVLASGKATFNLRDSNNDYLDSNNSHYANMINTITFDGTGTVTMGKDSNGNYHAKASYTPGEWYNIDCTIDTGNKIQSVTVSNAKTGAVAFSVSGISFRTAATNFKRISFVSEDTNTVSIKDCAVYTGTAPVKGTINAEDKVRAGAEFTPSTAWQTVGGVAPTSWTADADTVYTLYKDNLYTPADVALTITDGKITVPRSAAAGNYILEAYDGINGYAYKNIEITSPDPIQVTDSDIVLELNGVKGSSVSSDIYSDKNMTNKVTKTDLGIKSKSSVLSVLAKISDACAADPEYSVTGYSVTISKDGKELATVTPTMFADNNNLCMSQFVDGIVAAGDYTVTVTMTISQAEVGEYTVSKTDNVTITESTSIDEYFYTTSDGVRVTVFVK